MIPFDVHRVDGHTWLVICLDCRGLVSLEHSDPQLVPGPVLEQRWTEAHRSCPPSDDSWFQNYLAWDVPRRERFGIAAAALLVAVAMLAVWVLL